MQTALRLTANDLIHCVLYRTSTPNKRKEMIMTKFLTQKFLILALLVTSALTPTAYAQQQTAPVTSTQATVQSDADNEKRIVTEPFVRTELFFGTDRQDGPDVSEEEFQWFLKEIVTQEFPDGLTVLTGIGQFRDSTGEIIQEKSKLLILLYPQEATRSSSRKIEKIREDYKRYFQQQSVLRVDDPRPVRVSF